MIKVIQSRYVIGTSTNDSRISDEINTKVIKILGITVYKNNFIYCDDGKVRSINSGFNR